MANPFGQIVQWTYFTPLEGLHLAEKDYQVLNPGVVSGMSCSVQSSNSVQLLPGSILIRDSINTVTVRINFTIAGVITVATTNNYLVARYAWSSAVGVYAQVIGVDSVAVDDVILCTLVWNGIALSSVDNNSATLTDSTIVTTRLKGLTPKVNTNISSPVRTIAVTAGSYQYSRGVVNFAGGNSPAFAAYGANPRYDLLYLAPGSLVNGIYSAPALTIAQGIPSGTPVVPSCGDGLPIALVYIGNNIDSQLHPSDMTDIRPSFYFSSLEYGLSGRGYDYSVLSSGDWNNLVNSGKYRMANDSPNGPPVATGESSNEPYLVDVDSILGDNEIIQIAHRLIEIEASIIANFARSSLGSVSGSIAVTPGSAGLFNGTYYFAVTAVAAAGAGGGETLINTGAGSGSVLSNTKASFTWSIVPFAASYNLYYGTVPGVYSNQKTNALQSTQYNTSDFSAGSPPIVDKSGDTYYYFESGDLITLTITINGVVYTWTWNPTITSQYTANSFATTLLANLTISGGSPSLPLSAYFAASQGGASSGNQSTLTSLGGQEVSQITFKVYNAGGATYTTYLTSPFNSNSPQTGAAVRSWIDWRRAYAAASWSSWDSLSVRGIDDTIWKNLGPINWNVVTALNLTGYYYISGVGQTNSPNGLTNKSWLISTNSIGQATGTFTAYAIRLDSGDMWEGIYQNSAWTWTVVITTGNSSIYLSPTFLGFWNTSTLPANPNNNDTYIAQGASLPAGWIANNIYRYNTIRGYWIQLVPSIGSQLYNQLQGSYWIWTGVVWTQFAAPQSFIGFWNNLGGIPATPAGIVSTYSLVYTAAGWSTANGAYSGGVLDAQGNIQMTPFSAQVGQKVSPTGVVSTYSLVYTTPGAFSGGCLDSLGNTYMSPYGAAVGQKISVAGIVSTYSLVYTVAGAYSGGVLDPNGNIQFIPFSAAVGQKVNAVTGVVNTYSLIYTTTGAYWGGVINANGDIHFVPLNAAVGQKISNTGVVSTYSLIYTTANATLFLGGYWNGVLDALGDVHFVPSAAAVGQKVSPAGVVSTYSLIYTNATGAYWGGVLDLLQQIQFIPFTAPVGQKISPLGIVSTYSLIYTTNSGAFNGGVLDLGGNVQMIPWSSPVMEKEFTSLNNAYIAQYTANGWTENILYSYNFYSYSWLAFTPALGQELSSSAMNQLNWLWNGSAWQNEPIIASIAGFFGNSVYAPAAIVSTYSLIYTTANSGAYYGNVLDLNGNVNLIPLNAAVGQKVSPAGVVSTYSLIYTNASGAYWGGVLNFNGDIHFIPYSAAVGQKISNLGVVSTYSLIYTTTTSYRGGCLDPNGNIHFAPLGAAVGQKISSLGVVSTYSLIYTTTNAYSGGVLDLYGNLHFTPHAAAVGQKINTLGVVSTYSLIYTTAGGAYSGGVLDSNGNIQLVPYSAVVGQKILPSGTCLTYNLAYTASAAYGAGVLSPYGDIYFINYAAAVGQKISSTGIASTYSLIYTTTAAFSGGCLDVYGNIHLSPYNAPVNQKVTFNTPSNALYVASEAINFQYYPLPLNQYNFIQGNLYFYNSSMNPTWASFIPVTGMEILNNTTSGGQGTWRFDGTTWVSGFGQIPHSDDGSIDQLGIAWNRFQQLLFNGINTGSPYSRTVPSTYSLVYTTNAGAFSGGCLDLQGNIYFVPKSAQVGQKISVAGIVSTYSLVYTVAGAYSGGVLDPNGNIHFIPFDAAVGQKVNPSGVVSTYSLIYTTSTNAYWGGCLDPNGNIHFAPFAPVGQMISPAGVVSTYSLVYTNANGYAGAVLDSQGNIHFVPYSAAVGQMISPAGVVSTYSLVYTTSAAYVGGVINSNGDIHFVPGTARVGQKISSLGVVSTYSFIHTNISGAYQGGVLDSQGNIHFAPSFAPVGQMISPAGIVSTYSLVYAISAAYAGGILDLQGNVQFIPLNAAVGQKLNLASVLPIGACLSSWLNKL